MSMIFFRAVKNFPDFLVTNLNHFYCIYFIQELSVILLKGADISEIAREEPMVRPVSIRGKQQKCERTGGGKTRTNPG